MRNMTREQKDLLLKDICARLPYGVKCSFGVDDAIYRLCGINPIRCGASEIQATHVKSGINGDFAINTCKPYLFPMSSMTEEQCYKLASIRSGFQDCWKYIKTPIPLSICNFEQIDWFHRNHFDYRGLIEKGLAIDATNLNIY